MVKENLHKVSQIKNIRFVWLELIKAIALTGVFLNHIVEQVLGYPLIGNPTPNWPPLFDRLAQLRPLKEFGVWNIPINLIRYTGWAGEHGVQLFLIVSGFGLTWGLLSHNTNEKIPLKSFYRRRFERIYPLWWGVHILFVISWILIDRGLSLKDPAFYLSFVGIRITPALLYYFSPAWWYFGLILQLYLIYPILWKGLRRLGPLWFLLVCGFAAFLIRGVGLLVFDNYLEAWNRGAIFITKLPEFVFGMSLAAWVFKTPAKAKAILSAPATILLAFLSVVFGLILALTLIGMTLAPFLIGIGTFLMLYNVFDKLIEPNTRFNNIGQWLGQHSYSIYLIHHPIIIFLIPIGFYLSGFRVVINFIAVILLSILGSVSLEKTIDSILVILKQWHLKFGVTGAVLRITSIAAIFIACLISSDMIIRWVAPQEVLGWGERPSLISDSRFGWRLKPSTVTHLQWESYDYYVTSNSLGFPGPEYTIQKTSQTLRILTVGDAFTSAEGVNTDQAWPRLLEKNLSVYFPGRKFEVMNFAITGYGPQQYADIIEAFAPTYNPDLILIGFFANEYQDALWDLDLARQSIGFDQPSQNGLYSVLSLQDLRHFIRVQLVEPINEFVRNKPRAYGYFLGNISSLERDSMDTENEGWQKTAGFMNRIKVTSDSIGAKVVILMIPAPVQVCRIDQLAYYPKNVDLADSSKFDLELPQRLTQQLSISLGFIYYDLLPVLRNEKTDCPYQRNNMHWTEAGHQAVAVYIADELSNYQAVLQGGKP